MSTTSEDLHDFNEFVHQRLSGEATEPSLTELFDLWLLENPRDADYAENVAAITASIEDFLGGDRGTPAGEHSQQLRQDLGLTNQ